MRGGSRGGGRYEARPAIRVDQGPAPRQPSQRRRMKPALLLLGPRIRQCPGKAGDRKVRRRGPIDDRRNDARRQEGKRDDQADVPPYLGICGQRLGKASFGAGLTLS
jgi:hypothetical protein